MVKQYIWCFFLPDLSHRLNYFTEIMNKAKSKIDIYFFFVYIYPLHLTATPTCITMNDEFNNICTYIIPEK